MRRRRQSPRRRRVRWRRPREQPPRRRRGEKRRRRIPRCVVAYAPIRSPSTSTPPPRRGSRHPPLWPRRYSLWSRRPPRGDAPSRARIRARRFEASSRARSSSSAFRASSRARSSRYASKASSAMETASGSSGGRAGDRMPEGRRSARTAHPGGLGIVPRGRGGRGVRCGGHVGVGVGVGFGIVPRGRGGRGVRRGVRVGYQRGVGVGGPERVDRRGSGIGRLNQGGARISRGGRGRGVPLRLGPLLLLLLSHGAPTCAREETRRTGRAGRERRRRARSNWLRASSVITHKLIITGRRGDDYDDATRGCQRTLDSHHS